MGRKRQCVNCSDNFEFSEFSSYLLKLKSKTVFCNSCQEENYFIRPKTVTYFLFLLISIIIGVIAFFAGMIGWAAATYNPIDDTVQISSLVTIISGIFGLFITKLMLNEFIWKSADLTLDKNYKSASDYD